MLDQRRRRWSNISQLLDELTIDHLSYVSGILLRSLTLAMFITSLFLYQVPSFAAVSVICLLKQNVIMWYITCLSRSPPSGLFMLIIIHQMALFLTPYL